MTVGQFKKFLDNFADEKPLTFEEQLENLNLRDKGYVLVGVKPAPNGDPVILMIHRDWEEYDHRKMFQQAYGDLSKELLGRCFLTLEIPTLKMFEERWKNEDHGFEILYDGRQKS